MSDGTPYNPFGSPPPQSPPREKVTTFWTMETNALDELRRAEAILYRHPLGFELWITDTKSDGFARTQVHRLAGDAEQDAVETMKRLETLGWTLV